MRIGFVVEGSSSKAGDVYAIKSLCQKIANDHGLVRVPEVIAGGSKKQIREDAAKHVAALRGLGCARVVLLWDNCPPWTGNLDEEQFLWAVGIWLCIRRKGAAAPGISLVCSRREIEAWLLSDDAAVKAALPQGRGPISVRGFNQPDTIARPKDLLEKWWDVRCHRLPYGSEYGLLADSCRLSKLRRSPSFVRFEAQVV